MLHNELTQKFILLLIVVGVVLGLFFMQQGMIFKGSIPQPTPVPTANQDATLIITSPSQNEHISPDFFIQGKTRAHELSIRVSNELLGTSYYDTTIQMNPHDPKTFLDFQAPVHLDTTALSLKPNDKLTLTITPLVANGTEQNEIVTIPIYFSPNLP